VKLKAKNTLTVSITIIIFQDFYATFCLGDIWVGGGFVTLQDNFGFREDIIPLPALESEPD